MFSLATCKQQTWIAMFAYADCIFRKLGLQRLQNFVGNIANCLVVFTRVVILLRTKTHNWSACLHTWVAHLQTCVARVELLFCNSPDGFCSIAILGCRCVKLLCKCAHIVSKVAHNRNIVCMFVHLVLHMCKCCSRVCMFGVHMLSFVIKLLHT